MLTRYIVIYKLDTFEQVFGTESFSSVFEAQKKIMELEKQYSKRLNFQVCKIYERNMPNANERH